MALSRYFVIRWCLKREVPANAKVVDDADGQLLDVHKILADINNGKFKTIEEAREIADYFAEFLISFVETYAIYHIQEPLNLPYELASKCLGELGRAN
jgi:hypothetical protein